MDGRIFQIIGDGIVALFNSAGSAVKSAVVWQTDITRLNAALPPARRMEFRVGINSGDLLVTPVGAVIGDAINIAARVQTIAPAAYAISFKANSTSDLSLSKPLR